MTKTPDISKRPLALYNMWPRNYVNGGFNAFDKMTEDLSRVKEMGFNAVYVNPFYEVGHYPKSDGKVGSLYASFDMGKSNASLFAGKTEPFFNGGELTDSGKKVSGFCAQARKSGMMPMFDLVQSHLSPDSPYIEAARKEGIEILKKHPNGKYDIHGLDENYTPKTDDPQHIWDDVVKFNFDDPRAKAFIIQQILIPYVEQMADLGFRGVRIDSTPETPKDVHEAVTNAFKNKLREIENAQYQEPVILAETLNNGLSPDAAEVDGVASHCYSSGYFFPSAEEADKNTLLGIATQDQGRHWLKAEMWDKQHGMNGGCIIPVSTHDEKRLRTQLSELFRDELRVCRGSLDKDKMIARWARIKIAFSAMFSSGGYMMTSGDEYLLENRPSVFEGQVLSGAGKIELNITDRKFQALSEQTGYHQLAELRLEVRPTDAKAHPFWQKQGDPARALLLKTEQSFLPGIARKCESRTQKPETDLTGFITEINAAVAKRKPVSKDFYSDVYYSKTDPDVLCFISYHGPEKEPGKKCLHEVVMLDVASNRRHSISEDQKNELLEDFAQQAKGESFENLKSELITVGNFGGKEMGHKRD